MNSLGCDKTGRGWQHAQSSSKVISPNLLNSVYLRMKYLAKGPKMSGNYSYRKKVI